MKNKMNKNGLFLFSICMAGTLALATACKDNRADEVGTDADYENSTNMTGDNETILVVENDNNAKFLNEAAEMQLEEISLGKLAQQQGTSSHVKELGKMMENEHNQAYRELAVLSQSKSVTVPTSITERSKENYDDLAGKTANDFDKAYSKMMVDHHKDAIKLFEKVANDSEDGDIRTWASSKLMTLRTHLEHAELAKKETD
jgi:putative membrane protein